MKKEKRAADRAAEKYSYTLAPPAATPSTDLEERNATTVVKDGEEEAEQYVGATSYEYFANVHVRKASLNSTFFVHFYLGDPDCETEVELFVASNIIGSATVLYSPPSNTSKGNSTADSPITYLRVSLGHALAAAIDTTSLPTYASKNVTTSAGGYGNNTTTLTSLQPEAVVPYLTKQLQWRVQLLDSTEVDAGCRELRQGGLGVFVVGRTVTDTECEDEFPVYGELVKYEGITRGKKGGLQGPRGEVGQY